MGTGKSEEYICYIVEQHSTLLKGENGVLESSLLLIVDNFLYILALLLNGDFYCRKIVGVLNTTEVGSAKRQCALLQKWILSGCARTLSTGCGRNLQ